MLILKEKEVPTDLRKFFRPSGWARGENCAEACWATACHVCRMVLVFREVRRVLRDDACCWINYGDTFATGKCGGEGVFANGRTDGRPGDGGNDRTRDHRKSLSQRTKSVLPSGNLVGVPWRVALALQADGWILRQDIIWHKPCLSGGTWLYARTAKGDAPAMLKDLVRLDPKTVQLWNGKRWTQVIGWHRSKSARGSRRKNADRNYLEVVLRSGERIGCTAEHRWPTQRGLVDAQDLRVGDVIQHCILPSPPVKSPMCIPLDELGWLVGFYLAEGCKTEKGVNFSVHVDEIPAFNRIERLAKLLGGTATFQKLKGKAASIVVYSNPLRELIGEFISGETCYNKRLTRKAWMRSNKFLEAVFDGYLEGDGHWREDCQQWVIGFCNNDGLAVDLRCLCARLSKVCVLKRVKNRCGDKTYPGWRGKIRDNSDHHNSKPLGLVVAIENSRAREFWDIEVADEPKTFALASGILSHNSPMPESVVNRCTKAHEYLFLLAKKKEYFFDNEAIKEESVDRESLVGHNKRNADKFVQYDADGKARTRAGFQDVEEGRLYSQRNKRSVWSIASQGYPGAHYATFPWKLVEPCILAGTSEKGCCEDCGAPWRRVRETTGDWEPTCSCDAGVVPCTVMDPFTGSATTNAVSLALGRRSIGIDLSETYLRNNAIPRIEGVILRKPALSHLLNRRAESAFAADELEVLD